MNENKEVTLLSLDTSSTKTGWNLSRIWCIRLESYKRYRRTINNNVHRYNSAYTKI